jgi:hypothetical protein
MKCWNCSKEIPDGAGSCVYCECKQDAQRAALDIGALQVFEGLLSPELVGQLKKKAQSAETAEDFASMLMCEPCPECGSDQVETCEEVSAIMNPFVGRCKKCCAQFCVDCAHLLRDEELSIVGGLSGECPRCGTAPEDNSACMHKDDGMTDAPSGPFQCESCGTRYCSTCGHLIEGDVEGKDLPEAS